MESNEKNGAKVSIVKNTHHFNKNTELILLDGKISKLTWKERRTNKILDFTSVDSVEKMLDKIHILFMFVGIDCPESDDFQVGECTTINEKSITKEEFESMRKIVYDTPLEFEVKFISVDTCGCNMGYCSAITQMEICDKEFKTYGDVITLVGPDYPDSVMLYMEIFNEPPKEIYQGSGECYGKPSPCEIQLDPNITYIQWYYQR